MPELKWSDEDVDSNSRQMSQDNLNFESLSGTASMVTDKVLTEFTKCSPVIVQLSLFYKSVRFLTADVMFGLHFASF